MRDVMLITHFIGIAMAVGTGFAFMFLRIAADKMEKSDAVRFTINLVPLTKMGNIGLVLLFLSGGYLMTTKWATLSEMPMLMAKLGLFVVLGAFVGILSSKMKKITEANADTEIPKVQRLGTFAFITSITIIVLAVLVFD